MSNKVLVTGAAGFLGARIVRALVKAGQPVKALVRASSSLKALQGLSSAQVEIVEGDIRVEHSVYRALAGCDRLFHVAAVNKLWAKDPREILDSAVDGTQAVLSAAQKRALRRVVVTSSAATLGVNSAPEAITEEQVFNLEKPAVYIQAKRRAEELALSSAEHLDLVIAQPTMMLGPGDSKPTPAGQGILQFLSWNVPWIDFPVLDGGINVVDVDDVAQGHLLLLEKGLRGERYLLGGENLTYEQFFSLAADLTGVNAPGGIVSKGTAQVAASLMELWARLGGSEPLISVDAARDFVGAYAWVSSAKAEQLGYKHRSARRAVARGIQWFLDHGYLREDSSLRMHRHLQSPN